MEPDGVSTEGARARARTHKHIQGDETQSLPQGDYEIMFQGPWQSVTCHGVSIRRRCWLYYLYMVPLRSKATLLGTKLTAYALVCCIWSAEQMPACAHCITDTD